MVTFCTDFNSFIVDAAVLHVDNCLSCRRDFLIFQEPGKPAVNITSNNFTDTVRLNLYLLSMPISKVSY